MGSSPPWKVYDADGRYVASTADIEDAVVVMARHGVGSTVRFTHAKILWREGEETIGTDGIRDDEAKVAKIAGIILARLRVIGRRTARRKGS